MATGTGTELAKAYVQIIPSARGIEGSITNALGGEAGAAGALAGQGFGSKMLGMIKGVIATAAIGKAIASSVTEGAALEQSIGGIETLFKDSAQNVRTAATNAYRTAGLSANDYMETVTSFSASLLQGLGGDTAKAATIADTAITDMSDNANKMGTSMELIQNAYQGFAKQNYTMLDNLKLGYGGTKTEMQRLLADAQKVTGIKYDISNLSDVYSAIHVIQGELEITGTTAKEASTTISGSLASMQAAFKNVLANLALGESLDASLSALAQTATTFLVGNLLPAVWNIISAFPSALITFIQTAIPQFTAAFMKFIPQIQAGITTGIPKFIQTAMQLVTGFVQEIMDNLPQVLQSGQKMLTQLIDGIAVTLPQLIQGAHEAIAVFVDGILVNFPQILTTGKNVLLSIVSGIQQSFPQIIASAAQTIATLISSIVTHLPEIIASGFDLIISLIKGIGNAYPDLISAAGDAAKSIWETIKSIDWLQLGVDIISGLINGIGSMAGALWDAATNIARSALTAIKSFFGIKSPSRLMRDEVGKYIPLGLAAGIEQNAKPVSTAMNNLAKLTTGTLQSDLSLSLAQSGHLQDLAYAGRAVGTTVNYEQTIYTHDSLSEYELTRQAENLFARKGWKNP